jgi:hypothetical protein
MVRLEWEIGTVWPYVEAYIAPALEKLGVAFTRIDRATYATKGFWGGKSGKKILLPCYTDQSGEKSKLPEWCSGEWKREVVTRWAALQPGWKAGGVDVWTGISFDEQNRIRAPRREWIQPRYPLIEDRPTRVSGCLAAVERQGWPVPPRSRCHHCPNQSDAEWAELTPAEWETACTLDESVREVDPHAFLHRSLTPLRTVSLQPEVDAGMFGGCKSGMCF